MKKQISIVFIIFFFLVSCSSGNMPEATESSSIVEFVVTPVATLTLSVTITPVFTSTSTSFPNQKLYSLLISPDGTKRVQSYDGKTYNVLNASDNVIWSFIYDVNKFGSDIAPILSDSGYSPFYWSNDGKYIYITCHHGGEFDGSTKFFGNEFIDGCGVFKFDVDIGKMIDILPEITPAHGYYAFSISPDEKYLVYTNQSETPVKIKLLDLSNNKTSLLLTADNEVLETGNFGWSPDGNELTFMSLQIPANDQRLYSIFVLNLKNLKAQMLIKGFDKRLSFRSWTEPERIIYEDDYNNQWQLNIKTQKLSQVTTDTSSVLPTLTP